MQVLAWVRMIYREQHAVISVPGRNSRWIRVMRGVRQGCPLSPLLFNIIMKTLAIAIRTSPEIKGIQILTMKHKLALYDDDVGFFFK